MTGATSSFLLLVVMSFFTSRSSSDALVTSPNLWDKLMSSICDGVEESKCTLGAKMGLQVTSGKLFRAHG